MAELATRLDVPGIAVGVAMGQETHVAFHGVTNLHEPLPVDSGTSVSDRVDGQDVHSDPGHAARRPMRHNGSRGHLGTLGVHYRPLVSFTCR